jgi:hypothetical protein
MSLARGGEVVGDNCSEEITAHTCETRKRMRDCATECVDKLKVQTSEPHVDIRRCNKHHTSAVGALQAAHGQGGGGTVVASRIEWMLLAGAVR